MDRLSMHINQRNDDEKSAQVGRICEMFRLADNVLIWLGDPWVQMPQKSAAKTSKNVGKGPRT
jgi:hypothetical protein